MAVVPTVPVLCSFHLLDGQTFKQDPPGLRIKGERVKVKTYK